MSTTQKDLGRVVPIHRGLYSATTKYELNDIVLGSDKSTYWHIGTNATTGTGVDDQTVWQKVVDFAEYHSAFQLAQTSADMTAHDRAYVYVGTETGYENGKWYYYDNTEQEWIVGGTAFDSASVNNLVLVQESAPTDSYNKIWIDSDDGIETEVPEMVDVIDEFVQTKEYSIGDYVSKAGHFYKYIDETPSSGVWNASKWAQIVLFNELDDLAATVKTKANQTDLDELEDVVDTKAAQTDLDGLEDTVDDLKSALSAISENSYNLVDGAISNTTIASTGVIGSSTGNNLYYAPVEANKTYSIRSSKDNIRYGFFTNKPAYGDTTYNSSRALIANGIPITAPIDGWIAYNDVSDYLTPQVNEGESLLPYTGGETAIDSTARAQLVGLPEIKRGDIQLSISPVISTGAGKYVKANGSIGNNEALNMTDPFAIAPGFAVSVKAAGPSGINSAAIISKLENGVYTPLVLNSGGNVPTTYTYITTSTETIVVSYLVATGISVMVAGNIMTSLNGISDAIKTVDNSIAGTPLSMFTDIVCCGDSLTYSAVFTDATHNRQAFVPWPTQIERVYGIPTAIQAKSGKSPKTWFDEFGSTIAQSSAGNRLYITYFGHNASTQYPYTDTFETDCPADADPSTWADTLTGWWGRIINDIYAAGCKALIIRVSDSNGYRATQDAIIEDIAARWNAPVIDNPYLPDMIYHSATDSYANEAHYNDLGYMAFCRQLMTNINKMSLTDLGHLLPSN